MTGRPGPNPALRAKVMHLYGEDISLREIAKRAGIGYETVRTILKSAGIEPKPRVRGPAPLSPLALEIYGDMQGHFGGRCSKADLVEWLGECPQAITSAVGQLRRRGWVNVWDKVYSVAEGQRGAA